MVEAWQRMNLLAQPANRRLLAAHQYFYLACRLARESVSPGEFMAEVILNLAKTLEVAFPSQGNGKSRDAIRAGLKALGFDEQQIEGNFLPAIALRNEIDVAHAQLGLFTADELRVIHAFAERAEEAFRGMLEQLTKMVESGESPLAPYIVGPANSDAKKLVERLRRHTPPNAL